ncbi:MAG TPA: allantoinase AllB [Kofleriaceae bacterium]|nr:allantoinase AllB [Kofleriaceae bacterium]
MHEPDSAVRGERVLVDGAFTRCAVHIAGGLITAITPWGAVPDGCPVLDAGQRAVIPGLVDTHVHVNEPGRTEWEGFATATRAAAQGGITTLVDMPLNSVPPTTTARALAEKRAAAEGHISVDVGFWGGVIPGNSGDLLSLVDAGVCGFKAFLIDSGVPEFPPASADDCQKAMAILADTRCPLLFHAELTDPIVRAASQISGLDPRRYATYLASRPAAAEDQAIALVIALARQSGGLAHIVHHASADALALLEAARADGVAITAETCPHYLFFAAEDIADGATPFKCAPPIREGENRERLWTGLQSGVLDMVVSDHSPCAPGPKLLEGGDFLAAWGGIASLGLSLCVTWTEARGRDVPLAQVCEWMAEAPARLAGLGHKKGRIAAGLDADLVIFDPDIESEIRSQDLGFRHPISPYAGERLFGRVDTTLLRGEVIYQHGNPRPAPARGDLLSRS